MEECDYDHTWIGDSNTQGGEQGNCSVGEDISNMCKDTKQMLKMIYMTMWSCNESFDMPWMHVLVGEHENVEMPS